ncbi:MAG: hypothetical protein M3N82_01370 [Pseudomonadota bacterium]|nr:hypothetical protein [Pseudomonadota bacterium]
MGARAIKAGLFDGTRFESASRIELTANDDDFPGVAAAISSAISALGEPSHAQGVPRPCRVVISDFWLRATELPWSARLLGADASISAHIRAQFEASGWEVADGDCMRWDDAGALKPRLAVLYPVRLLAAIRGAAQSHQFVLASVRPLSTVALELSVGSRPTDLAVIEDGVSTFIPVHAGRLGEPTIELTTQPRAATLAARRRRALFDDASGAASSLAVLDLSDDRASAPLESGVQQIATPLATNVAGHPVSSMLACVAVKARYGRHSLDAFQAPTRRGRIHALTALALVGVAVFAVQARQSTTQLATLRSEILVAAPVSSPLSPPLTKAERSEWQRISEITREINAPIGALMGALRSPADIDVQVVSADVDAAIVGSPDAARRITVQAESHQALDMQRYVDFLSNRPTLASATLVRHDLADGSAGSLYRFTVEATWRP